MAPLEFAENAGPVRDIAGCMRVSQSRRLGQFGTGPNKTQGGVNVIILRKTKWFDGDDLHINIV